MPHQSVLAGGLRVARRARYRHWRHDHRRQRRRQDLLAPAVPGHEAQRLHGPDQRVPDCVLADEYSYSWHGDPPQDVAVWAQQTRGADYTTTYDEGGFIVACRP